MYESYFGLSERPFSITPDPRYLYLSARHREAFAHLAYGIRERGGFVQLTGEVGTGKTLVARAVLEDLPDNVDVALILNPSVTVREFLTGICRELGIPPPKRSYSVKAMTDALYDYLLASYGHGRHTVVLVDEAQNLSQDVIEQVRLLTNLETSKQKLLQIILVGQPELRVLLARHELRQVAQRVTARYHLEPLTGRETRDYIQHRVRVAGVERPLFSPAACFLIRRFSRGIPRLINIICDRALLGAYASGRHRVNAFTVWRAAREINGKGSRPRRFIRPLAWSAVAALFLGTGAYVAAWTMRGSPTHKPVSESLAQPVAPASTPEPKATRSLDRSLLSLHDYGNDTGAFQALFSLWGVDLSTGGDKAPCDQAENYGLRCYEENGGWARLMKLGLPAVLDVHDVYGTSHRIVLKAVKGGKAQILYGGSPHLVDPEELRAVWAKKFTVVWRPPSVGVGTIQKGMIGPSVRWLREQLDQMDGHAEKTAQPAVFGDALEKRVRDFQRRNYLTVDGVVGENTLVRIVSEIPNGTGPRLQANEG